jgi:hypothetical protein
MPFPGATNEFPAEVQRKRVLLANFLLDFLDWVSFFEPSQQGLVHDRVHPEFLRNFRGETGLEPDDVENIADIHQPDEFVFGHDFPKAAITGGTGNRMFQPGLGMLFQLVERQCPYVGQVRGIARRLLVGLQVGRKGLEKLRASLCHSFNVRGVPVQEPNFRGVIQAV